jgi:hypothetical protein
MTETARFTDLVQYTESQMAEVLNRVAKEGIIYGSGGGAGLECVVTAPGGMFVRVASGEAWLEGFWYKNDANVNLTVPANATGSTRLDYVVLHLDRSANTINAQYKTGTVSLPVLTQIAGGTWEIPIAIVSVANGAGSISSGNITDARTYNRWQGTDIAPLAIGPSHIAHGGIHVVTQRVTVVGSVLPFIDVVQIPTDFNNCKITVTGRLDNNSSGGQVEGVFARLSNNTTGTPTPDTGGNYLYAYQFANNGVLSTGSAGGQTQFQVGVLTSNFATGNYYGTFEATFYNLMSTSGGYKNCQSFGVCNGSNNAAWVYLSHWDCQWWNTGQVRQIRLFNVSGFNFVVGTMYEVEMW